MPRSTRKNRSYSSTFELNADPRQYQSSEKNSPVESAGDAEWAGERWRVTQRGSVVSWWNVMSDSGWRGGLGPTQPSGQALSCQVTGEDSKCNFPQHRKFLRICHWGYGIFSRCSTANNFRKEEMIILKEVRMYRYHVRVLLCACAEVSVTVPVISGRRQNVDYKGYRQRCETASQAKRIYLVWCTRTSTMGGGVRLDLTSAPAAAFVRSLLVLWWISFFVLQRGKKSKKRYYWLNSAEVHKKKIPTSTPSCCLQ